MKFIQLTAPRLGIRSFVTFLGLAIIMAIIFILTGSYGSFSDILMSCTMSGLISWLLWVSIRLLNDNNVNIKRLQYMLSSGCYSLLLIANNHHPAIEGLHQQLSVQIGINIVSVQNVCAFLIGAIIGLTVYLVTVSLQVDPDNTAA
ncbi:hypothetical protein [Neptunicella marina]|uniref:Uncharacterized protein n=1 Tax=Neptunicella marina TaxID=2125989 RepID=A0A8J6IRS0_9ALTE|nr:hypothetical protein [Neptunicella marina]MBC3764657.1 hypothetical protein [Neptunicella marina]